MLREDLPCVLYSKLMVLVVVVVVTVAAAAAAAAAAASATGRMNGYGETVHARACR